MQHFTKIAEEIVIGGSAAGITCIFTNPLDVIKTRLQLQGELKPKGTYEIHYKNFVHAVYTIGKADGLLALQSGLLTGILYQFVMNGTRLGFYQLMAGYKLHMNESGTVSYPKAILMGATAGAFGAFIASPLYLVKTHFQVHSKSHIAVGFQRQRVGLFTALKTIYIEKGIGGLWRGWQTQVIRVMIGSSAQLSTFSKCKDLLHQYQICDTQSISNTLLASCVSGVVVTLAMAPFDVLSTRIYNQPLNEQGKGKYYSGIFDAICKVPNREGYLALYKGSTGVFMRLTPHTVIMLVLWDHLRQGYHQISKNQIKSSIG